MLRTATLTSVLAGTLGVADANPASTVPSAGDPGHALNVNVRLDYEYQLDRSLITRERVGRTTDPLGAIPRHRDLDFHQFQHVLIPRAELAVFRDTWLSVALPVTIGQVRELELASGVTRDSSSTLQDGILPYDGFDARDPSAPPPGNLVFRGNSRSGLDQVHVGLHVAPMNQRRDDTKPTWRLGGELRFAIGEVMRFDAMDPGSEGGVSKGVHELRLDTSVARQFAWTAAWIELFWQVPIASTSDSLFDDPGFGASNEGLSQTAGAAFGLETFVMNDKVADNRISLDLGARIVGHFEGRQYSEMWEAFALAGDSRGAGPLILDADPTQTGVQALSHPGITNVENHLETAARIALRAGLGKHVRFAAVADLAWKTDHAITFADAGIDLPTCDGSGSVCEADTNDLVNPGTSEVNPIHVQRIDLVGHRYHSVNNFGVVIGIESQVLF